MLTKEEYYEMVKQDRVRVTDPNFTRCVCPVTECEWHGRCKECVALHRHYKDHLPVCLQPLVISKIKELAGVAELKAVRKEGLPAEYAEYIREQDEKERR